jgi:hypothetical protein
LSAAIIVALRGPWPAAVALVALALVLASRPGD